MEKFFLDREIKVAYIAAVSFPEGLGAAYKQLHETFPEQCKIAQYGISFGGPNRSITYWAAVEATSEVLKIAPGLPTFTLHKGTYVFRCSARLEKGRDKDWQHISRASANTRIGSRRILPGNLCTRH